MQTEPLISWPQPLVEYAGFVAAFLATGAIGFRFGVLGRMPQPRDHAIHARASKRAAALGLTGVGLGAVILILRLPGLAAERHRGVIEFVAGNAMLELQIVATLLALAGFALALGSRAPGWPLAASGVLASALRAALSGRWERLVNPVHMLAGGIWIGTLFVVLVAGFPAVLESRAGSDRRGVLAAQMVNTFSPMALVAAGVLATFGVITAWQHLKRLEALWTTPYGFALITKLCVVAAVAALGAWNWRRQRPRLGTDQATMGLRRSAAAELIAAAVVLAVTAVLVSLPSPSERRPGRPAPATSTGAPPGGPRARASADPHRTAPSSASAPASSRR